MATALYCAVRGSVETNQKAVPRMEYGCCWLCLFSLPRRVYLLLLQSPVEITGKPGPLPGTGTATAFPQADPPPSWGSETVAFCGPNVLASSSRGAASAYWLACLPL